MGSAGQPTPFGAAMKEHFLFAPTYRGLNHGSFGTYPKQVRDALRQYQDLAEARPDKYMRYQYVEFLDTARADVANLLGVPQDECVLVQNATSGVNLVLRNLVYKPGDVIIYFDTIYAACEKTLLSILETSPQVQLRKVEYEFPCSHTDILNTFAQTVSRLKYEGLNPKVAVFDTIVSVPGVRLPFERLTKICREYGILSMIDAAHGVGQIPINLRELAADFFVSNLHKWLYVPRGCAVFHVPKRNQHLIRTTYPTSHGFQPSLDAETMKKMNIRNPLPPTGKSPFVGLFEFVATSENAPYYTVPAAMKFRRDVCGGDAAIYEYIRDIAQTGGEKVAEILGTKIIDELDCEDEGDGQVWDVKLEEEGKPPKAQTRRTEWTGLRDCAMVNILLPLEVGAQGLRVEDLAGHVNWIQSTLLDEQDTFIQVFDYKERIYCRLSGQIYLELSDFEWAGGILKDICVRLMGSAMKTNQALAPGDRGGGELGELEQATNQLKDGEGLLSLASAAVESSVGHLKTRLYLREHRALHACPCALLRTGWPLPYLLFVCWSCPVLLRHFHRPQRLTRFTASSQILLPLSLPANKCHEDGDSYCFSLRTMLSKAHEMLQMFHMKRPKPHTCDLEDTIRSGEFFTLDDKAILLQIREAFPVELERLKHAEAIESASVPQIIRVGETSRETPSEILYGADFDEINRTLVGVLALRWICNNAYDTFVGTQQEAVKLHPESFKWLHDLFTDELDGPDDILALVTSMIINDLGKDPNLQEDYYSKTGRAGTGLNHDMLLHEAAKEGLVPSLDRLGAVQRENLMLGLELGSELNAGQLAQAENVPINLEGLLQMRGHEHAFAMKFMEQILDLAGAGGHSDATCAIRVIEPVFQAFKIVYEVAVAIIKGESNLREGYDKVLTKRGNMLHNRGFRQLTVDDEEQRALLRLLTMGRTADKEQAELFTNAFHGLDPQVRASLVHGLNLDGDKPNQPAILPYYMPAMLSESLKNTRGMSAANQEAALGSLMRYLTRVLEGVEETPFPDQLGLGGVIERNMLKARETISSRAFRDQPAVLDSLEIPKGEFLKRRRTSNSV